MKSIELTTLIMYFAIVGAVLSAIFYALKWHKTLWMTFLQNFCGVWFIFSGFVKAVDPIGTKYKLEQYFAEFDTTFAGCALKGLAPMFPFLSKYALPVGIFTIILEIVLGVLLIFGVRRKLTAWLFFGLMLFFTALTGFTYLTGYVPQGTNFFDFAKWGSLCKNQYACYGLRLFWRFHYFRPENFVFQGLVFDDSSIFVCIFYFKNAQIIQS